MTKQSFIAQVPQDAVFARFSGKHARRFFENRHSLTILGENVSPVGDGWSIHYGIIGESHFLVVLNPRGIPIHAELLACVDPQDYKFGRPDLYARFTRTSDYDLRSGRSKDPGYYRIVMQINNPVLPEDLDTLTPHRGRRIVNWEMPFPPPPGNTYGPKTVLRVYLEAGKLIVVTRHEYAFAGVVEVTPLVTVSEYRIPRS